MRSLLYAFPLEKSFAVLCATHSCGGGFCQESPATFAALLLHENALYLENSSRYTCRMYLFYLRYAYTAVQFFGILLDGEAMNVGGTCKSQKAPDSGAHIA